MARRSSSGDGRASVRLEGLSELAQIPGFLEHGQREFLKKAGRDLAKAIADKAPGGAGGSIGRSARARTLSPTKVEIVVEHPGAKALEKGAFIRAKRGSRLKFTVDGQTVFAPAVRLRPLGYAKRALRKRNSIVREAYQEAFDQLGER